MKKSIAIVSVFLSILLLSCNQPTQTSNSTATTTYSIEGAIQKGPFQVGSAVTVQEVDKDLVPTGSTYSSATKDDLGAFTLESKFSSKYVEITSKGFYLNECTGQVASAELTLRAYLDLSLQEPANVNVMTTLAHDRIKTLVASGSTFLEARSKAEEEVLAAFGLTDSINGHFNGLDLVSSDPKNAVLLAISAALQNSRSVVQLSALLADLGTDLSDNGIIDSAATLTSIRNSAAGVNASTIRTTLQNYYKARGKTIIPPDFANQVASIALTGGTVAAPKLDLASGVHLGAQTIGLTCSTAGAEIFYTLDGSVPTKNSTKYTGKIPLALGTDTTIKAIAVFGNNISALSEARYIVKNGKYAADYWKSTPGFYIEYDYSGTGISNSKIWTVFQEGKTQGSYALGFCTNNKTFMGSNYLDGPLIGSTGYYTGWNSDFSAYILCLAVLPSSIIEGEEFNFTYSNTGGTPAKFIPQFEESWSGYSDVIRITFDTTMLDADTYYVNNGMLKGTGHLIYAKGVGLVHLEMNRTDGVKRIFSIASNGAAPKVTIAGTVTQSGSSPFLSAYVAPSRSISRLHPDSFEYMGTDAAFSISQYVVPGSYFQIHAYKLGANGQYDRNQACKKFCVNGYTTPRSEYGHHQGSLGRALEGLQGS